VVLVSILAFQCPLISASDKGVSAKGDFVCDHVVVKKINLALKEVDLIVDVYVVANSSFLMATWVPWKEGGTFWAEGVPVANSSFWHDYHMRDMPMNRLIITTKWNSLPVFLGLNPFPLESYETRISFGFNITNVKPNLSWETRPTLSSDLEEPGVWNVAVRVSESGIPNTPDAEGTIAAKGLKSFVTVSIMLSHTAPYIWKMLIPTWGPLGFLCSVFATHLLIRRRLGQEYQVAIAVVTAAVSAAGIVFTTSLRIGEFTASDLALSEVLTFGAAAIYPSLVVAFLPKHQISSQQKSASVSADKPLKDGLIEDREGGKPKLVVGVPAQLPYERITEVHVNVDGSLVKEQVRFRFVAVKNLGEKTAEDVIPYLRVHRRWLNGQWVPGSTGLSRLVIIAPTGKPWLPVKWSGKRLTTDDFNLDRNNFATAILCDGLMSTLEPVSLYAQGVPLAFALFFTVKDGGLYLPTTTFEAFPLPCKFQIMLHFQPKDLPEVRAALYEVNAASWDSFQVTRIELPEDSADRP
jgi:hypothetical protein